jgi:hypothetical protein
MKCKKVVLKARFQDPKLNMVLENFERTVNCILDELGVDPNSTFSYSASSFKMFDWDASNTLELKWDEGDRADRIINFKVGGGSRIFELDANLEVEATSTLNQDTTTDATTVNFGALLIGSGSRTHLVHIIGTGLDDNAGSLLVAGGTQQFIQVDSASRARFICDASDADASLEFQEDNTIKWVVGFDYTDSLAFTVSEGVPGTNNRLKIASGGVATFSSTLQATHVGAGVSPTEKIHTDGNILAAGWIQIDSSGTAIFYADSHDADAHYELREDGTTKWTMGFDYNDSLKFKISEGAPGTNTRLEVISGGSMNVFDTGAGHIQIDAAGSARFMCDSTTADSYTEYQDSNTLKWCTGYDYDDSGAFTISEGAPGTNNRLKIASGGVVTIPGTVILSTVADAATDTDKFLVLDGSDNVDYRTGAELADDIEGSIDHNNLANLQGGTGGEYYHLNSSEHTELTAWLDDVVLGSSGALTLGGNLIIPNAGYIGSVSDTDAIQIEADGDIVMTQDLAVSGNVTSPNYYITDTTKEAPSKTTGAWSKSIGAGGDYADWATMIAAMPDTLAHTVIIEMETGTTLTEECTLKNKHAIQNVSMAIQAEKYFPTSGTIPTADGGGTGADTMQDASVFDTNDEYNNCWIMIVDGTGTDNNGFIQITDTVSADGEIFVASWPGTQPDNTSRYIIVGALVDAEDTRNFGFNIQNNSINITVRGIGITSSEIYSLYGAKNFGLTMRCCGSYDSKYTAVEIVKSLDFFMDICGLVGNNNANSASNAAVKIAAVNFAYIKESGFSDNNRRAIMVEQNDFMTSFNTFGDANGTWGTYVRDGGQATFSGTECSGSSGNHFYEIDNLNPGGDICTTGNIGIGSSTFGTNADQVLLLETGTAPSGNVTDCFQMYSSDIAGAAGKAGMYIRDEGGLLTGIGDGFLILDKTSGKGIKIDTGTPTFGWRDLLGTIIPRERGSVAPAFTAFRGGQVKDYAFSGGDEIDLITYHIPHDYVKGTDIFFHPHWGHNGTAISGSFVLDYYVTYAKGHGQAIFLAEINLTQTIVTTNITTHPRWCHEVNDIQLSTSGGGGSQLDTDLLEPDGVIQMAVITTTIPTITGSVESNLPYIFEIDVHYQSTNIATKDKKPDFYA